jgi:hypothetical protein
VRDLAEGVAGEEVLAVQLQEELDQGHEDQRLGAGQCQLDAEPARLLDGPSALGSSLPPSESRRYNTISEME